MNQLPRKLGDYELGEEIGHGGMSVVYKAWESSTQRYVAIKMMLSNLGRSPDSLVRFQREVGLIARLQHPYILPIYGAGADDGAPYLVMRYLEGGGLDQTIKKTGRLPLTEALVLFDKVASALDYAHSQNVIHRDIKPSNVMLDAQGNPYLTDFGIAKAEESTNLTGTGLALGTPDYMAPEQWSGITDNRSDIYALGVMLFQLLTGRLPFTGTTPMQLMRQHTEVPPPSARLFDPNLPGPVDDVMQIALAKDPDRRYQTAWQLVDALHAAYSASYNLPGTPGRGISSLSTGSTPPPRGQTPLPPGTPYPRNTPYPPGTPYPSGGTPYYAVTSPPSSIQPVAPPRSSHRTRRLLLILGPLILLLSVGGGALLGSILSSNAAKASPTPTTALAVLPTEPIVAIIPPTPVVPPPTPVVPPTSTAIPPATITPIPPSPTAIPSQSPLPSPTVLPSATIAPTVTLAPLPTDVSIALPATLPTLTPTDTPTPANSVVVLLSPVTNVPTQTFIPTLIATPTVLIVTETLAATQIPSDTPLPPTEAPSDTQLPPTETPTEVPSFTDTETAVPTPTATDTPLPTATPQPTETNTPRPTKTNTPRPTSTKTRVPTRTPSYTPVPPTDTPFPTDTPLPTAIPTITPTPSKTPDPLMPSGMSVLFEDEFADNSNNWSAGQGSHTIVTVNGGTLRIEWPVTYLEEFYTPFVQSVGNFYLEANLSVKLPANPAASFPASIFNNATWGVLFRAVDAGYYLVYVVPNTCTLGFAIYTSSNQAYRQSGSTLKDCADLGTKPQNSDLKLQIVGSGGQFTVYINGSQKMVFKDTKYTQGIVGFFAYVTPNAGSPLALNIHQFVVGG
ncbi:MAG: serine/threonine-protein kinase [Aggregatilineales bacterium]